jgi:putative transposase
VVGPSRRRQAVNHAQETADISERRACKTLDQPRSTQRYEPKIANDEDVLISEIHKIVQRHPRYGVPRVYNELRYCGWQINHKRVERLWRKEGLKVPQKRRKKRRLGNSGNGIRHRKAEKPNHIWTWDFIFDRLENGRPIKWLTVIDEFTRENVLLYPSHSIRAQDVIDLLSDVFEERGAPQFIRSDNGPEFISKEIVSWLADSQTDALYVEPGAPWENGFIESFNSRFRDDFLGLEIFSSLFEAQVMTRDWRDEYNRRRPHSSLGRMPPEEFASKWYDEHRYDF